MTSERRDAAIWPKAHDPTRDAVCGTYAPETHVCQCTAHPDHPTTGMPHRCICGRTWPAR